MAPEIIDNWRVSTGRITAQEGNVYRPSADVFSTTVVVWECLTGEQPYVDAAGNPTRDERGMKLVGVTLTDAIVAGRRPGVGRIPNGEGGYVSERMQALLERGWAADPEARPTAEEMAAAIGEELAALEGAELVAPAAEEAAVLEQNPVAAGAAEAAEPVILPHSPRAPRTDVAGAVRQVIWV